MCGIYTFRVSACERRSERVESGVWPSSRASTCFCNVCSSTVASSNCNKKYSRVRALSTFSNWSLSFQLP